MTLSTTSHSTEPSRMTPESEKLTRLATTLVPSVVAPATPQTAIVISLSAMRQWLRSAMKMALKRSSMGISWAIGLPPPSVSRPSRAAVTSRSTPSIRLSMMSTR